MTEKNLLGNWVLLYFGYTSSPDIGPAEVRKMANTIDVLGSPLLLFAQIESFAILSIVTETFHLVLKIRIKAEYQGLTLICHH